MSSRQLALELYPDEEQEATRPRARAEGRPLTHADKPRTRAQCADIPRPCPFVSCRQNLALVQISKRTGKVTLRSVEGKPSCTLDVVDDHAPSGMRLREIADALGVTRQAVQASIAKALTKARKAAAKAKERGEL